MGSRSHFNFSFSQTSTSAFSITYGNTYAFRVFFSLGNVSETIPSLESFFDTSLPITSNNAYIVFQSTLIGEYREHFCIKPRGLLLGEDIGLWSSCREQLHTIREQREMWWTTELEKRRNKENLVRSTTEGKICQHRDQQLRGNVPYFVRSWSLFR